jgi:hypothetical protein
MRPAVWTSEGVARLLGEALSGRCHVVNTAQGLEDLAGEHRILFVDRSTIHDVTLLTKAYSVVAVCDGPIQAAIDLLQYPWLAHVLNAALLEHSMAREHLANMMYTMAARGRIRLFDWLRPDTSGRRVRLAESTSRIARLEKMTQYFESHEIGARTIHNVRDVAEELLTNAFYDAPVAAGAVKEAIPRTKDVTLPERSACEIAYGCSKDLVMVRVRDPFGSLTRRRLINVLTRCSRPDQVNVDESMGGAGLGLWRIFSRASLVAVAVVAKEQTDILVGFFTSRRGGGSERPYAFHLFFDHHRPQRSWGVAADEQSDSDRSITLSDACNSIIVTE